MGVFDDDCIEGGHDGIMDGLLFMTCTTGWDGYVVLGYTRVPFDDQTKKDEGGHYEGAGLEKRGFRNI
jgi:hypothetical protein